ncbi:MAG: 16S rRNA (guanine(966)-N(2))-methyltransferase RsmD [Desulfococcaceae bacterium]
MRIIAGEFRGRKLLSVRGMKTRPTSDRIRENIFNILSDAVQDAVVLDLFAGTGAMGIEALSRGARYALFIEQNRDALAAVSQNIRNCSLENRARIMRWDIVKNLSCIRNLPNPFTLVFMDPPYDKNMVKPALQNLIQSGSLSAGAVIVAEHSVTETVHTQELEITDQRKYGKTAVSFLRYNGFEQQIANEI